MSQKKTEPVRRIVNILNSKSSDEYDVFWIRCGGKKRGLYITEDRAYLVHPWQFEIKANCSPKLHEIYKMIKVLSLKELMSLKNYNETKTLGRSDFLQ